MTIVYFDGFTSKNVGANWSQTTVSPTYSTTEGRGTCLMTSSATNTSGYYGRTVPGGTGDLIVGAAFKLKGLSASATGALLGLFNLATSTGVSLVIDGTSNGAALKVMRLSDILSSTIFTTGYVLSVDTWYYVELRSTQTLSNTSGTVTVRVNGITIGTYTGDTNLHPSLDNLEIDTATIGRMLGSTTERLVYAAVTDFYIVRADSGPNNTYLGNIRVAGMVPSGAGSRTDLTPVGSGTNWQNVDEQPTSTTDYNHTTSSYGVDQYAMSDPIMPGAPLAVKVEATGHTLDGGTGYIRTRLHSGLSDYTGTDAKILGPSPVTSTTVYNQNPWGSSAWDASSVNAIEAGAELSDS